MIALFSVSYYNSAIVSMGERLKFMEKNLTSGSVWKNLLCFSLPFLLSYFLQTLYGMADLYIIGQFEGAASITAVSVGSQVMHMITVMVVGLAMGTTVSIARAVGSSDRKRICGIIGNTVVLFAALSLALTGLLLLARRGIVSLVATPDAAVSGTVDYLTVCFFGIPFIVAYNIISAIFRGMGDSKTPMFFIAAACFANIVLDYYFMGFLGLGPVGAALGTTLSQALSVVLSLAVILTRRSMELSLHRGDFRPQKALLQRILRIGMPIMLQDGFVQISFLIITVLANQRGLTDAAAVGIVEKIISFLFLVPSSMLSAVSALGAQNLGADKPQRAVSTLWCAIAIAAGFGLCASLAVQLCAGNTVALFTADAAVAASGGEYLRGYIWDCFFAGIQFSFSGYFCALGRAELSFLHNVLSIVLVRVPGAYLACRLFPQTLLPMGLASAAGSLLSVIVCLILFRMLQRKNALSPS